MLDFNLSQSTMISAGWANIVDEEKFDALTYSTVIARIALLHQRSVEYHAIEFNLSRVDSVIMFLLAGLTKAPLHMSDLWKTLEYTPGAVSHRINRLLKLEYVETRKSDIDSRSVEVKLTEEGKRVIGIVMTGASKDFAGQLDSLPFTPSQRALFDRGLKTLELAAQKDAPSAKKVRSAKPAAQKAGRREPRRKIDMPEQAGTAASEGGYVK